MKRKGTGKGIMAIGSLRTDGITTYMKQGRLIIRSAYALRSFSWRLSSLSLHHRHTQRKPPGLPARNLDG